jgi:hypothetical protein
MTRFRFSKPLEIDDQPLLAGERTRFYEAENLRAWALTMGYDPTIDYTTAQPVSEPLDDDHISENFTYAEFACNHCGKLPDGGMDMALIDALEAIRAHYGAPITINSGYRCPTHNANVGGATNSQHLYGTAADIVVAGISPAKVYADLDPVWQGGLGKYSTFTHCDVREGNARWSG